MTDCIAEKEELVRALDTIFKFTYLFECIMLIPESDNWVPNILEMPVSCAYSEESDLFSLSMDHGRMAQFFFLAFLYFVRYVYCPL